MNDQTILLSLLETAQPTASKLRNATTKTYFIPFVYYRNKEVVLCEHRHLSLKTAEKCLARHKKPIDEILNNPLTPKRIINKYTDIVFKVREVVLKRSFSLKEETDHYLDGKQRPYRNNALCDEWIPSYAHFKENMTVDELKTLVDCYHDQPKRRSKNYSKLINVVNLSDFLTYKEPPCLLPKSRKLCG